MAATTAAARPSSRTSWWRYALLVGTMLGDLAILRLPRHSLTAVVVVLLTSFVAGVLIMAEHLGQRLAMAPIVAVIAVVMMASVAEPPRTSNDVWSYAIYGRMVTVYGDSPYDHVPAEFAHDPFERPVSPLWRHRASVYGPLFVGVSALDSLIAGDSLLVARLFFQLIAGAAVVAMLVLAWRMARSTAALLFLALNPVLVVIVVNGGHNDALIGLALLGAALLAFRDRALLAGLLIGAAALIKVTALLALVGLVLWALRHGRKRLAVIAVSTTAVVTAFVYLPVIASASRVLDQADRTVTDSSPWNIVVDRILGHDAWRRARHPLAPNATLSTVFYLGAALVVAIAVALAWHMSRERRAEPALGVSVAAYPFGAEYAYPWYTAWSLPLFGATGITAVSSVVWIQSVVMLGALKLPLVEQGRALDSILRVSLTDIAPLLLAVALVVAACSSRTRQPGASRPSGHVLPSLVSGERVSG